MLKGLSKRQTRRRRRVRATERYSCYSPGWRCARVKSLADIDWDNAIVRIKGKSRVEVGLPLPQDVGDALVAYIEHNRPGTVESSVFLCAKPPHGRMLTSSAVTSVVREAIRKSGIRTSAGPTSCATLRRPTCFAAERPWRPSQRSCVTAPYKQRQSTPRSTPTCCQRSSSHGWGAKHADRGSCR